MLFIGYSNKDRYTIVEPILFHLKHFGLEIWYDFQDMFLGDDRYQTNFVHGIGSSTYIIFIISPNLFDSACAMEELAFTKTLIEKGNIVFFPVFYHFSPDKLPEDLCWINNIIYNEVKSNSGSRYVAYQIAERVYRDDQLTLPYQSMEIFLQNQCFQNDYIMRLLTSWINVDERNYGLRIGILYSLYQYLPYKMTKYNKAIEYLFSLLQMNEKPDHLIYSIFEKCIIGYCSYQLTDC